MGLAEAEADPGVASTVDGPGVVVLDLGEPALPDVAQPPAMMRNSNKTRNETHGNPLRTGSGAVPGAWLDCPDILTTAPHDDCIEPCRLGRWATESVRVRVSRGKGCSAQMASLTGSGPLDADLTLDVSNLVRQPVGLEPVSVGLTGIVPAGRYCVGADVGNLTDDAERAVSCSRGDHEPTPPRASACCVRTPRHVRTTAPTAAHTPSPGARSRTCATGPK